MISDYISLTINSILHRRLRAWLTILGIVIGVASIIALISISQGLKSSIEEQFATFGTSRLFIAAKSFQGPGSASEGLTEKDVTALEQISDFKYVAPVIGKSGELEYKKELKYTLIAGFPAEEFSEVFEDMGIEVSKGRMFNSGEKYVAVIGSRVATDLFKDELRINNKIKIQGVDFKVIGIFEEIGNQQDDNQINIPYEAAKEIFNTGDKVDYILAQVKEGIDAAETAKKAENKLERTRDDENFQVLSASQIAEQINSVLGIIQVVLIGIAAISLVVGGIGIMNSMYTSVLERTKEIGIMKSIGARNSDILMLFLLESGFIGLIGGVFGVLLGSGIGILVGKAAASAGYGILKIKISFGLIMFGLAFAIIIGMISGALPARQASKLKPVDALRYE
ncbi:ABC transporter permease [Candidatus Woesearchaeota archaeon]|nr:ABC transporter permease [Candidatus Woesearchaeota archaeon]